jgi:hypothetical protein
MMSWDVTWSDLHSPEKRLDNRYINPFFFHYNEIPEAG